MIVHLVTTWESACGIAEHSAYLKAAVEAADPSIAIHIVEDLHPHAILQQGATCDLLVLNYHAALLSQWTPDAIRLVQEQRRIPVVVIYHDTGVPNTEQCKQVSYVLRPGVDRMIVHEPFDDLPIEKVQYWRMGVPDWTGEWQLWREARPDSWCGPRPILGTIGFPFPWKNYEELARITAEVGWALLLIAPMASEAQITQWRALNPHSEILPYFVDRYKAVAYLAACDATAFLYTCANTGQSAAILQGVAARKPVFAFESCRQFRALYADPLANKYIRWCTGFNQFRERLSNVILGRVDCGLVALAEQDGWPKLGQRYASLWRELVASNEAHR